jgi:putative ubiquitin-RnfH superfamily antitoxin RatB of RatAB toxin-antitoxin module
MATDAAIVVQIAYARADKAVLRDLTVPEGTTLQEAIFTSGILRDEPDVDLSICKVGIFGKVKPMETVLRENDRIEIYRPLIADPKDARHRRVKAERKEKASGR